MILIQQIIALFCGRNCTSLNYTPTIRCLTTYGTQLYPLSKARFATDAMQLSICFTQYHSSCFVWAIRRQNQKNVHTKSTRKGRQQQGTTTDHKLRKKPLYQKVAQSALLYGVCYLGICQIYSWHCLDRATAQFRQIGFEPQKMRVKPPILFSKLTRNCR